MRKEVTEGPRRYGESVGDERADKAERVETDSHRELSPG
jgi:hypothetical protein